MEDNPVYLTRFAVKDINVLSQIFEEGNLKPQDDLKLEYTSTTDTHFLWLQQKHAITHKLKTIIKQNPGNDSNVLIQDYHLIKGALILTIEKLSFREFYSILINLRINLHQMSTFRKSDLKINFNWRKIYILPGYKNYLNVFALLPIQNSQ